MNLALPAVVLSIAGAAGLMLVVRSRVRAKGTQRAEKALPDRLTGVPHGEPDSLAKVVHELRSPANGIVGLVATIRAEGLDPDTRHKLKLIQTCAGHLSDLIDSFPTSATESPCATRAFNVAELLESVRTIVAASTNTVIPLQTLFSSGVPPILIGDELKLRQILLNYALNAVKHVNHGKIVIAVSRESLEPQAASTTFWVSDDGPGLQAEDENTLFQAYERGASAKEKGVPGSGLGLAVCRQLAHMMNGTAWASKEGPGGSRFSVKVNLAAGTAAAEPVKSPPLQRRKLALVVDDEEHNRLALAGLLEQLGFVVHCAATEREASGLASDIDFELICIDCVLAGSDGLDLARAIRSFPSQRSQVPILAVSGFTTPTKRKECLEAGMSAFVAKPVTSDKLRFSLQAILPTATLPPPPSKANKGDRFKNLRLLAVKKSQDFGQLLETYLGEFEVELRNLIEATAKEDLARTKFCTHVLYGRCAFIQEYSLETTFRRMEIAAVMGQWKDAQSLGNDIHRRVGEIRSRITFESRSAQSE